jgi:hypothetical protein
MWLAGRFGLTPDCAAVWASAGKDKSTEATKMATVSSIVMRFIFPHPSARLPTIANARAGPEPRQFTRTLISTKLLDKQLTPAQFQTRSVQATPPLGRASAAIPVKPFANLQANSKPERGNRSIASSTG